MKSIRWAQIVTLCFGVLVSARAGAQGGPVPNEAPRIETQDDAAFQIGKQLRCPVCQGMPIAESPSTMAQDMMKRVRAMLAEGKSKEEVLEYFVGSYGEWVLLQPRAKGFNMFLWLLPPLALLLGLYFVVTWMKQPGSSVPAPGHEGEGAAVHAAGDQGVQEEEAPDPYLQAVREEVQR